MGGPGNPLVSGSNCSTVITKNILTALIRDTQHPEGAKPEGYKWLSTYPLALYHVYVIAFIC